MAPKRGTTRRRTSRGGDMHLPMHMSTMKGLHKWHKREFEKFGWMLLAKAKGYDFKIKGYKMAIDHLIASIKHVMGEYQDPDRKHDLNVLLMNTMVLREQAHKVL